MSRLAKRLGYGKWMKGKKLSEKSRRKIARFGEDHPTAKTVLNMENGIYYHSIREGAESLGLPPKRVVKYLLGYKRNRTPLVVV